MKLSEVSIGMLVRRVGGSGSFLPDAQRSDAMRGRRLAQVVAIEVGGRVLVRWINSQACEKVLVHRLEAATGEADSRETIPITAILVAPDRLQLGWAFPGVATPWATRLHRRRAPRPARTTPQQLELPLV